MAKRDIPEINAGSMADIAFLLLIFFLVTTTMDKDQAYRRNIPKKVNVPPSTDPVEERNVFLIKANNQNQIFIRDAVVPMDDISEKVLKFYRTNEKKIVDLEYPFYSRISMEEIDVEIRKVEREIEVLENTPNSDDFITVKNQALDAWIKKKNALALYKGKTLPEINSQANIRIEVSIATQYEIFAKIHAEIEEALTELKNEEAKRLFDETFEVLRRKNELDASGMAEKNKLDLLDLLYPARIIEVTPKK